MPPSKPYRFLFPLALPLAWAGVLPWFLFGIQASPVYPSVFHSIAQIQGLMTMLAAGFLLTAIPGRTGTAGAGVGLIALCALAPVATVALAAMDQLGASHIPWLAMVASLLVFVRRRFRAADAERRPPDSFVWVPLSLGMGILGSLFIGAYGIGGASYFSLHQLGKLMLLQGMFVGLVVGVAGMVLPLITRGEGSLDGTAASWKVRTVHGVAGLLLLGTLVLEVYGTAASPSLAYVARGAIVLAVLLWSGRIYRLPTKPGMHRVLVWLAVWCIPLGYLLAGVLPTHQAHAGLHLVFIGGMGGLGLCVALHVSWAHGDDGRVHARPLGVVLLAALFVAALVTRALVVVDPQRFLVWLTTSSGAFLAATLVWAWMAAPAIHRAYRPKPSPK